MKRIAFTAHQQASIIDSPDLSGPLKPNEIRGRTLFTLVSPGTEINFGFLGTQFPYHPGYAAVFQVEEAGSEVEDAPPGTNVFASASHVARQQAHREHVQILPENLAPETAVFARLASVSMSTLNSTIVRPPSRALVTGLGPVGILAAQIFAISGYEVIAVDPVASRRSSARAAGLKDIRSAIGADLQDKVAVHIECSGHEQAVLDGAKVVRKGGEIFLVGVPWQRKTEVYSFDLLHAIFHRYVVVRSGWEWQVPIDLRDFEQNSITENLLSALNWLSEGRLRVAPLGSLYKPEQAQEVYSGLYAQTLATPTAIFDWR